MLRTPTLELTERAVRAAICKRCPYRPKDSEMWNADAPRPCERDCRLFIHLPMLRDRARLLEPMLGSHRQVLANCIKDIKNATHSQKRPARADGLSGQGGRVIDLLAKLYNR